MEEKEKTAAQRYREHVERVAKLKAAGALEGITRPNNKEIAARRSNAPPIKPWRWAGSDRAPLKHFSTDHYYVMQLNGGEIKPRVHIHGRIDGVRLTVFAAAREMMQHREDEVLITIMQAAPEKFYEYRASFDVDGEMIVRALSRASIVRVDTMEQWERRKKEARAGSEPDAGEDEQAMG